MGYRMSQSGAMILTKVFAVVLFATVFCGATAFAAAPVPKPKPQLAGDPQAAIAALMDGERGLSSSVSAYAPNPAVGLSPTQSGEVALYLVGKLSEAGEPIGKGLAWRIFRDFPDETGNLPLVHRAEGGDLEVRLKPGRYIVHASYGRAAVSRTINLAQPVTSETVVLDAGGLRLEAVMDADDPTLSKDALFEIYRIENGERELIGTTHSGAIARLPAGAYHVVSRYGDVNAVRSADVEVVAGKLTSVALRHRAGTVRLKLVRNEGGEAIANTAWTVFTDEGKPIFSRVGAHASLTLAAGEYAVVAKHRDTEFSRSFVVQSGAEKDVVVLARRL